MIAKLNYVFILLIDRLFLCNGLIFLAEALSESIYKMINSDQYVLCISIFIYTVVVL